MTNHTPHTQTSTHHKGRTTTAVLLLGAAALATLGIWILTTSPDEPDQSPQTNISGRPQTLENTTHDAESPTPQTTTTTAPKHQNNAEQAAEQFISAWRSRSWETTRQGWEDSLERTASETLVDQISPQVDWESLAWERYRDGRSVTTVNVASAVATDAAGPDRSGESDLAGEGASVIVEFDVATMSEDPVEQSNPVPYRMMVELSPTADGFEAADVYDLSGAGGL